MPAMALPTEDIVLEQLKNIRLEAGLTQTELANRLGKPQSYVAKYEGGARKLNINELFVLCEACGVDASMFCKKVEQAAYSG